MLRAPLERGAQLPARIHHRPKQDDHIRRPRAVNRTKLVDNYQQREKYGDAERGGNCGQPQHPPAHRTHSRLRSSQSSSSPLSVTSQAMAVSSASSLLWWPISAKTFRG